MDPQTRWTRLEPHAREGDLRYGLNAEIHDPLWLLTRQWQLLEFWGEDAGSPIFAQLDMTCSPITRYYPNQNGTSPADLKVTGQAFNGKVPLEAMIEKEAVRSERETFSSVRLAVEAGLHFLRLLSANGAGALREAIIQEFRLEPLTEDEKNRLDSDTVRFMEVMAKRVPSGTLLKNGVRKWPKVPPEYRTSVKETIDNWEEWYTGLFYEPIDSERSSWVPPRLEYQALISASTPQGEVALTASEYADGHLDWYSFDALAKGSLGATVKDVSTIDKTPLTRTVIPTPVTFRGMPAARYWEFEDANIDFGGIAAGQQQLAHLLLVEFGLVSGDDWFVIPVVLPVGTLCYTNTLMVTDTFGGPPTSIRSARAVDQDQNQPLSLSPWDLFHLSLDASPKAGSARSSSPDALFLPPALGTSLHGKVIEEVFFMRDEMANMVWAVERSVESALGRPLNQSEAYFRTCQEKAPPSVGPEATLTRLYRLASEVPSHWVPMLPVPLISNSDAKLGLKAGNKGQGRVLSELGTTLLYGEEVPQEGVRVSRAYQYTRWTNGQSYLWVGRRNEVGRGEGSSGLVFDQLEPPSDTNK